MHDDRLAYIYDYIMKSGTDHCNSECMNIFLRLWEITPRGLRKIHKKCIIKIIKVNISMILIIINDLYLIKTL